MKITTLIENTLSEGGAQLKPEHGISLFIEHRGKNILFDTGSSSLFARNADALGIDLKRVDFLVLSHAHLDHAGGLARFMEINPTAPVVLLSRARQETYLKILFIKKYIGVDRKLFDTHAARFRFFDDSLEITPGVTVMANTVQRGAPPVRQPHAVHTPGQLVCPRSFRPRAHPGHGRGRRLGRVHRLFPQRHTEHARVSVPPASPAFASRPCSAGSI